jgi:FG-GAP-like repeat
MSKLFRTLFSILVGCASLGSLAQTTRSVAPAPHTVPLQQQQQEMPARFRSPLQQIVLPQLQKRLAAAASQKTTLSNSVRSASIGVTATTPNFAGFNTAPYYPAIQQTSCLADPYNCGVGVVLTADFDKDGKPDVAVVQYDGTLDILLNNGNGGFAAPASYANPTYSTTELQQAFVADFNNDGYPDIIAIDFGGDALIVYPNLKNGTFGSPTVTTFNDGFNPFAVAAGDVNGDGYPDVVIASYQPNFYGFNFTGTTVTVTTYLGLGNLNFNTQNPPTQSFTVTPQVAFAPYAIALGDFNRDGKADIALELWDWPIRKARSSLQRRSVMPMDPSPPSTQTRRSPRPLRLRPLVGILLRVFRRQASGSLI